MQISNYNSNVNFQAIRLKPKDYEKSKQIMSRLANPALKREDDINELYNIFYPYIQKEAEYKSKPNTFNDVFSEMNLLFLELVNDIKNNPLLKDIISKLNRYKPSKDVHNIGDYSKSLDIPAYRDSKRLKIDNVTRDQLPEPQSAIVLENVHRRFVSTLNSSDLPKITKSRLQRIQTQDSTEIAKADGVSTTTVGKSIQRGILRIQYQNCCVPMEIQAKVNILAEMLGFDYETTMKMVLKNYDILYTDPELAKMNMKRIPQMLNCTQEEFKQVVKNLPQMLYLRNHDALMQNVRICSEYLGCSQEEYIKAGLYQPVLFYKNVKTLKKNMERVIKYLGCTKEEFVEACLKLPTLFSKKYDNIVKNIEEATRLLGWTKEDFVNKCLKNPIFFQIKAETLYHKKRILDFHNLVQGKQPNNTISNRSDGVLFKRTLQVLLRRDCNVFDTKISEYFDLEKFIQANADKKFKLQIPECEIAHEFVQFLSNASNKTIGKNIFEFDIIENYAIKNSSFSQRKPPIQIPEEQLEEIDSIAKELLKLPTFKDKNINFLKINIFKIMYLFNLSSKDIIGIAKKQPRVFDRKPESLYENFRIYNYYQKISHGEPKNELTTINKPRLYSIITYALLRHQHREAITTKIQNFNLVEFLKANRDNHFTLEIPQDEVVQGFIDYITLISRKTIGKNIFEFKIIENSAKDIKPLDKPAVEIVNEKLPNVVKDIPVPKDTPPLQNQTVKLSEEEKIKQINDVVANLIKLPKFSNEDVNYLRDYVQKMLNLYILSPKNVIEIITYQPGILNFKPENLYKLQFSYKFLPPNINRIAIQQ